MRKLMFIIICFCVFAFLGCEDDNGTEEPTVEITKISITSVTLFEGNENGTFSFKVSTSAASEEEIKVDYRTQEVTAGEIIDFIPTNGTLTIPAGERNVDIDVEIVGDTLKEIDETFKVILSNPINAEIANGEGLGTIRNEDTYVFVPEDGYITPESYTGYNLVWNDEFDGTSINSDDWTHEIGTGDGGWGNNELQYYTNSTSNSYLSNGSLIIEAKEQSFQGSPYTSARLITKDKQIFQYGRVDIRAILPEGQGIWPALWMLGNNISDIGWPACGEVDIMELVGHEPSTVHGTAHWGPQGQSFSTFAGAGYSISGEKFSEAYHVFSVKWEANSIKWLVDDEEYFSIDNGDVDVNYPFNDEFFFIFNIAVGGNWPGSPDATTQFPQKMFVDYIRIFQEQ